MATSKTERSNPAQLRFLQQSIDLLRQEFRYSTSGNLAPRPIPLRLAAARRAVWAADAAIIRFKQGDEKRRERLSKQINQALNDARASILFQPPTTALRVVTECERKIKQIVYGKGKVTRGA